MNSITIEDYNPEWPRHFAEITAPIRSALDGMVVAIEHVGSTAVPGLAAKPVIDIDVVLKNAGDLPDVVNRLHPLGYRYRGDLGIAGREAFSGPEDLFPHHLYVCLTDGGEYRRHIAFRDYLRAHPDAMSEYAALKRELAVSCGDDRAEYSRAKSHFVMDILAKAAGGNA